VKDRHLTRSAGSAEEGLLQGVLEQLSLLKLAEI
jgi:hypothetical protein